MSRTSHQQLPNLDKLFKEEDDQDFAPLGGSNLAALFGSPQKLGDASTVLKQSSQKKPSSGRNTPQTIPPANKTEVILAKVVHAYKLHNGQYSMIGKLGIVLTGNTSSRIYQIILYRSNQEHLSMVTLTPEFSYTIRENNYATYYDSNNENWSLYFENETSCIDFAREVGVSRFNSRQTKTDETVFHQNLTVDRETNDVKENDEVTLKSIICTNLSQPLKINGLHEQTMNIEISKDENWERSLLNTAKGLKRLLILPPSKQISLGPGFPREREIIMEIEIIDVIKKEDRSSSSNSPLIKTPVNTGKASILSRMAKMGQSMLPKVPTSTTTDSEDTEEEVHVKSPRRFKADLSSHTTKHHSRTTHESSEDASPVANVLVPRSTLPTSIPLAQRAKSAFSSTWPTGPIQQQYVTMDGQYYPVHQTPVTQSIPGSIDPSINVFLSETRTQNTEIRMGISKLADNVQKLLDKFHVLEVQSASSPIINERAMETSLRMLMALNASKSDSQGQTDCKNSSNFVNASSNDLEKESKLKKELDSARVSLEQQIDTIRRLEAEKRNWSNEKSEFSEKIENLENALQKSLAELKMVKELVSDREKDNATLRTKISTLNAEKTILEKSASASLDKKNLTNTNEKTAEIKRIMNKTYQTLLGKFTEESYTTEYIKQTVASTIRNITLHVLQEKTEETQEEPLKTEMKNNSENPEIENDDNASVTLSEINSVDREEPPPIPPVDIDTEANSEWLP